MNKKLVSITFFLVAGLALIALAPGDPLERLSNIGIGLLVASFTLLATEPLDKKHYRTITYVSWGLAGLILLVFLGIFLKSALLT